MTAPRRHLIACLVPLIAVVTGSCAVSSLAPISFPADYSPEEGTAGINAAPACAHIRSLEVSDERPDTLVAGQRSVQDKPERHAIFMEGNIESWLRSGVRRALDLAVIRDNPSSGLVLSVTLTSLVIEEVAYVNSEYEGLGRTRPGTPRAWRRYRWVDEPGGGCGSELRPTREPRKLPGDGQSRARPGSG